MRRRYGRAWRVVRGLGGGILLVLGSVLPFAGCGGGDTSAAEKAGQQPTGESTEKQTAAQPSAESAVGDSTQLQKKEKAIKVNVAGVRRGDLIIPVHADGVLRTLQSVDVRTKAGGELTEVLVRDGDRVRAGQVLARIDDREHALSLEDARYRHFQALSQIAAEDDQFTVNREALDVYAGGKRTLDERHQRGELNREQYQAELLALELIALEQGAFRQQVFEQRTGLADARSAEERARLNLEYCTIRAPFDGVIQGLAVVRGEILSVGAQVCTVFNNDRLEAVVNVLEADLGNLERGRQALLAIPATRDTLRAQVDVISPNLDQASRTCEVILRIGNPAGRYRPGMFVQSEIAGWVHHGKLQVPKNAVLMRDNRPLVFKVVGQRAQWLYVDLGLGNDDWAEITAVHSGGSLAPGEQVVVSDHLTLAHEALIEIRETVPPDDRWELALEAGNQP